MIITSPSFSGSINDAFFPLRSSIIFPDGGAAFISISASAISSRNVWGMVSFLGSSLVGAPLSITVMAPVKPAGVGA